MDWEKMLKLYRKHRQVILYLFFGVCTTLINTLCYHVLYQRSGLGNILSTVLAWAVAVLFAFVTNKLFVFQSRAGSLSDGLRELGSFFGFRLLTGVLDVIIMAVAVDLLHYNGVLWKLISNVIVTILNYVASKFIIFRKET